MAGHRPLANHAGMLGELADGDQLDIPVVASADAPAAGLLRLYGRSLAGRCLPEWVGGCGLNTAAQPLLGQNRAAFWNPPGAGTGDPGAFGLATAYTTGTKTSRWFSTSTILRRMKRIGYVSASSAGSVCSWFQYNKDVALGNGTGLGGFTFVARFGVSDESEVSGARMFVGLRAFNSTFINVEPSTLINCIGVAQLSTSNNMHIVYGGSAAQAPIDLGPNFPANTLSADAYEIALFASPNIANQVGYRVTRLGTQNVAEGTLTAATAGLELPLETTLLTSRFDRTNNTTALAVGLDVCSVYIETDY